MTNDPFAGYLTELEGQAHYMAGLPGYPRNFSRDTLLAGILASNAKLLDSQLRYSARHLGLQMDIYSGEEPGKIHHEYPGFMLRDPYLSTYNACDTTALYLIAIELLGSIDAAAQAGFLRDYAQTIQPAIDYIQRHIQDDIFWEFPPDGAGQYSLRITYWKDSIMPNHGRGEEPQYPIAFALAHFQNARGLLAASRLLRSQQLADAADRMFVAGIRTFITPEAFCVAIDARGRLEQPSSDELHCLAYIPTEYVHLLPVTSIWGRSEPLITPAGIACLPRNLSDELTDTYHGHVVWIFEQAYLHYACNKFGLADLATITERCLPHIADGQELLSVEPLIAPLGNTHQLWSVAARLYFESVGQEAGGRQLNL